MSRHLLFLSLFVLAVQFAPRAQAVITADQVVSYTGSDLNGNSALGLPSLFNPGFVDPDFGFPAEVVSPFDAAYDPSQLVTVPDGTSITLRLSGAVSTTGQTLGVHTGVGLYDYTYPDGETATLQSGDPLLYTNPRSALVDVSQDGTNWVPLNDGLPITFDDPTNAYSAGVTEPSDQATPGTQVADFGKPFLGDASDFYNKDWNGVLGVLQGSGGGTWLDLSGTGLSDVKYVRFTGDDPNNPFELDAITAVPEPGSAALVLFASAAFLRRVRRGAGQ